MEIILDSGGNGGNGGNGGSRVRLITGSAPPLPALAARELPAITHRPGSPVAAIPPLPARAHAWVYNDRRWSSPARICLAGETAHCGYLLCFMQLG